MAVRTNDNSITVDRETILKKRGMVILSSAPTHYLKGKEAEKLDKLVKEGLREYSKGKIKEIKSLAELD